MADVVRFPLYPDSRAPFDLGSGFSFRFASWAPDRAIPANNERYREIPDVERICITLTCRHGKPGICHLDRGEVYKEIFQNAEWWTVLQEEPLTLDPSIDTGCCHGYIKNGKWEDV
jgi:hypothetical protein